MMKRLKHIAFVVLGAVLLHSCFKDVVSYTDFNIAVYDQSVADGEILPSTAVETYAYYVDTTEWSVLTYEDALARRITNKTTGEVRSTPDVEGTFDVALPYPASVRLEQPISMLVLVNPTLRLYAYRKYELPINLATVDTKLYMASWRGTHSSSGWLVKNDFYKAESEEN
ncbi:MAG: hypothetical protein IKJ21_07465 [Alistipes sp.]|nr:hypothetical protein [Alistipes sp.]